METIQIKAKDLYIEHMVDAMADYIKEHDEPVLKAEPVKFINERGAFWDNWHVSSSTMDAITRPFVERIAKGKHETTPKGVVYRCMSGRDATFMVGEKVYFMSV